MRDTTVQWGGPGNVAKFPAYGPEKTATVLNGSNMIVLPFTGKRPSSVLKANAVQVLALQPCSKQIPLYHAKLSNVP